MFRPVVWWSVMTVAFVGCQGQGSAPATNSATAPASSTTTVLTERQTLSEPDTPRPVTTPATTTPDTPKASADGQPILYADHFAGVGGHVLRRVNGETVQDGPKATRGLKLYADPAPEGEYQLELAEETTISGPDGQPGLLRATWAKVPMKLKYSGFVYVGQMGDRRGLAIPDVSAAKRVEDLAGIALRLKLRAINPSGDFPPAIPVRIRLEIDGPEAYTNRCDFGVFELTETWQTIDAPLLDAENIDAFVEAIVEYRTTRFQLVLSQANDIVDYRAGDTILIDDFEIVGPKPASVLGSP